MGELSKINTCSTVETFQGPSWFNINIFNWINISQY